MCLVSSRRGPQDLVSAVESGVDGGVVAGVRLTVRSSVPLPGFFDSSFHA
jgi:hypothetical protein